MRVFLRMNGAPGGCMAKFPETFEELLQIANAKLVRKSSEDAQLSRVFIASGDEISAEEFACIENGDVLYFSRGEDWIEPPVKEPVPDDKMDAEATPQQSAATVPIAPVKSQTGRPIKARGQLPPGWTATEFTSSTGKSYRRYVGPSGAKLQSVSEVWRAHNATSTGQLTIALVSQGKADASTKSTPTMETVNVELADVSNVQALDAGLIGSSPAGEDQIDLKRNVPSDEAKLEEGEEDEDVFEVEAIIGKRIAQEDPANTADCASTKQSMSCDEVEYLVIWSGYPKEDNSWTPASDILDQALIEDFERREAKREAMSVEEQREYLTNMGLSLDGCDDNVSLRDRVAEAEAAALQTRSLSKKPSNPVKLALGQDSKRQKLDGADKRAGDVERKKATMQAREAERQQKATEKLEREETRALERALDKARKDAEKHRKEAEREADKKRKEEEKQAKASEKEEERQRKEEERQRKEEERQRKEEERKIKAQEKEAERERREKEREAELAKVEAVKKRQSITNFFGSNTQATNPSTLANSERSASNKAVESGSFGEGCEFEHSENISGEVINLTASPVKRGTGETEESGRQIYLRGGKRVVPFYIPEHTRLAPRPHGRKPKGPAARRFLAELSEYLRQRAEGGHEVKPPRMPTEMQLRCRRQMRRRKIELPAWQWAPMKTLSFHEDVRPAYLGTFSRPSISTTSAPAPTSPCGFGFGFNSEIKHAAPLDTGVQELKASEYPVCGNGHVSRRRPWGRDTSLFDYELDSEAEWEPEVEDGEDLGSDLDGEEKDDDDAMSEDEQDDWLVKDGESDPAEEQPGSSSRASRGSLVPMLLLGPLLSGKLEYEESSESQLLMQEFSVQLFDGLPIRPHAKPDDARLAAILSGSGGTPTEGLLMTPSTKAHPKVGKPTQCVAPRDLPRLAMLVHGNAAGIAKLIDAFLETTPADIPKAVFARFRIEYRADFPHAPFRGCLTDQIALSQASRMQVEKEIRSMASRESVLGGKVCWRVRAELVEELGISTPAHHDATLNAVEDLKKSQQEVKVTSHPTKVLNPAMRSFLKPALSTGDKDSAAFGSCANHVSRDQGDDGEGTVKMLFQGETA